MCVKWNWWGSSNFRPCCCVTKYTVLNAIHELVCHKIYVIFHELTTTEVNPLQPSGRYMYRQCNINQLYVLSTQCIYVFCVDLRTNSDYFTVQHWLFGFYNWDGVCLLRGTFYILRSAHTVYLCVLCGSENKQRLFHCTTLTGWFL